MPPFTYTYIMSKTGDLYRNIDSIESKCVELISQIDHHLCISGARSLVTPSNTNNVEHVKNADVIFLSCHQSIVDYSSTRRHPQKNVDLAKLPKLQIAKEFCEKMTKINQPLPKELLSIFKAKEPPSIKGAIAIEPSSMLASKKQVAFNLNVQNDDQAARNCGNVAMLGCSHYSQTHSHNQREHSMSTKDSHAHAELMIDSQPHVHNDEWLSRNSTVADNLRAFLFGSLRNSGKLPKTSRSTIVSLKTKRDFRRKKLKQRSEKLKIDEGVGGRSGRK